MTNREEQAREEFKELLARIKKQMLRELKDKFKEQND